MKKLIPIVLLVVLLGISGFYIWKVISEENDKAKNTLLESVGNGNDWTVYRNEKYGFEIKYPNNYDIIEGKESWPNSVFLLWDKCHCTQAYSLAVEVWDDEYGFKKAHTILEEGEYKAIRIGDRYITLWNLDEKTKNEIKNVMDTFKIIE